MTLKTPVFKGVNKKNKANIVIIKMDEGQEMHVSIYEESEFKITNIALFTQRSPYTLHRFLQA